MPSELAQQMVADLNARQEQAFRPPLPFDIDDPTLLERFLKSAGREASFGLLRKPLATPPPETIPEKIAEGLGAAAGFGVPLIIPGGIAARGAGTVLTKVAARAALKKAAGRRLTRIAARPERATRLLETLAARPTIKRRMLTEAARVSAAGAAVSPPGGLFEGGTLEQEIKGRAEAAAVGIPLGAGLGATSFIRPPVARAAAGAGVLGGTTAALGGDPFDIAFASGLGAMGGLIPRRETAAQADARIMKGLSPAEKEVARNMVFDNKMKAAVTPEGLYVDLVNEINPIRKADDLMSKGLEQAKLKGPAAVFGGEAYATLSSARNIAGTVKAWIREAVTDMFTGNPVAEPMVAVIKAGGGLKNYIKTNVYLYSRRAVEAKTRAKNPIELGLEIENAKRVVAESSPEIIEAGRIWDNRIVEIHKQLIKSGIKDKTQIDAMEEAVSVYAPVHRLIEGFTSKVSGMRGLFKKQIGGKQPVLDIIETQMKNEAAMIQVMKENIAIEVFIGKAEASGIGSQFIERVKPPVSVTKTTLKELLPQLKREGVDLSKFNLAEKQMNVLLKIFRSKRFFDKEQTIMHWRDGKRVYTRIKDKYVYDAFKSIKGRDYGIWMNMLSFPAKMLRLGATSWNFAFAAPNAFRDATSAFIYGKYGLKPGEPFFKGMMAMITNDPARQRLMAQGMSFANNPSYDRPVIRREIQRAIDGNLKHLIKHPLDVIWRLNEVIENATRVGEGMKAEIVESRVRQIIEKAEGRPVVKGITPADTIKAVRAGREISLDFEKMGGRSRAVNMITAFHGAGINSFDRTIREFKSNPGRSTAKAMLSITVPSMLLFAVNHDDPGYWRIPQWQRDLFWIVKVGDTYFRLPRPWELGIVFGAMPERLMQWLKTNDPQAFDGLVKRTLSAVTPPIIPTFATPFVEQFANKSLFTGQPIVPMHLIGAKPELQTTRYTGETAKQVGKAIGVSPARIESVVRNLTGGVGRGFMDISSEAILGLKGERGKKPSRQLKDVPLLGTFVVRSPQFGGEPMDRFYKIFNEVNSRRKSFSLTKDPKYFISDAFSTFMNKEAREFSKLRKQVDQISVSPYLDPKQKRVKLDEIAIRLTQRAERALEIIRRTGIK